MSPEQRKITDGLVLFSVKDKDFLGMNNQFIGEAFVHFSDIPDTTSSISSLPQVRLQLNRPTNFSKLLCFFSFAHYNPVQFIGTDAIKALENRQGDKLAKEFIKRIKQKSGNGSSS